MVTPKKRYRPQSTVSFGIVLFRWSRWPSIPEQILQKTAKNRIKSAVPHSDYSQDNNKPNPRRSSRLILNFKFLLFQISFTLSIQFKHCPWAKTVTMIEIFAWGAGGKFKFPQSCVIASYEYKWGVSDVMTDAGPRMPYFEVQCVGIEYTSDR